MANRIFTITPGRSGMHYVKALCKHCTDLPDTATPEYFPEPKNYEEYLDNADTYHKKADWAHGVWDKMPETFFSTSGLTKNGYLQTLGELGARFVSLRRNTVDNAYSWHLMNGAPGELGRGIAYHPCIESPYNCLVVTNIHQMSSFQKCLWLVLETKARAQHLADLGFDVYFVNLEDLNFKHQVEQLFKWMGVNYDISQADRVLGHRINPLKDASRDLQENPHLDEEDKQRQIKELSNFIKIGDKVSI